MTLSPSVRGLPAQSWSFDSGGELRESARRFSNCLEIGFEDEAVQAFFLVVVERGFGPSCSLLLASQDVYRPTLVADADAKKGRLWIALNSHVYSVRIDRCRLAWTQPVDYPVIDIVPNEAGAVVIEEIQLRAFSHDGETLWSRLLGEVVVDSRFVHDTLHVRLDDGSDHQVDLLTGLLT